MATENYKEVVITEKDMLEGKSYEKRTPKEINELQDIKSNLDLNSIHPDFIAVLRSYDQVNGSVFNGKTRQNIIKRLIYRAPDSKLTNYKLASAKLATSLANVANLLESKQDKLYKTADNTLNILDNTNSEMFKKEALGWLYYAIPAALGLIYWQQHAGTAITTIKENGESLKKTINLLINSGSGILDDTYTPLFKDELDTINDDVDYIIESSVSLNEKLQRLEITSNLTRQVAVNKALSFKVKTTAAELTQFNKNIEKSLSDINTLANNLDDESTRREYIQSRGTVSGLLEQTGLQSHNLSPFTDRLKSLESQLIAFASVCDNFTKKHQLFLEKVQKGEKKAEDHKRKIGQPTPPTTSEEPKTTFPSMPFGE
jgi:hypothetical protein